MKNRANGFWAMAAVLALAGTVRFHDLSRAAVRSDEIGLLFGALRDQSLVELWKNPPWFNQIPLGDSIPVAWSRLTRQTPDEGVIRQPFAFMGFVTVAFCAAWMIRRRGVLAGLLLGVWMALLPYHVYHSREAYYYVMVMLFSSFMALRGADFATRLRAGGALKAREYAEWTAWALLVCLSHMSAWVVAGVTGLLLALAGWAGLKAAPRKRHWIAMGVVVLAMGAGMIRWVLRAIYEMRRAAADPEAHVGSAFDWVGPRVLPSFSGGANAVGVGILMAVLAAAGWVLWKSLGRPGREDPLYGVTTWIAACGVLGSYAYIFAVGGGDKAKLTYFAANLPVFLVWAAMTADRFWALFGARVRMRGMLGCAALVAATLAVPAWKVTQLDGKPTAYRQIRAWLDSHLSPGDVAIVDRWWEPWNEMALYAPSNVFVTFTVPDEPYENYMGNQWRQATKNLFERNGAQAFIRLSRNYERRMGLWIWPETWFRRRASVTHEAGLWLRDAGFAPMEEFYSAPNRVVTEIFYDTHEDIAERAKDAGKDAVWFFGEGWKLFKPWQQGDFTDYRVLPAGGEAMLTLHNLRGEPFRAKAVAVAAATGGNQVIQMGGQPPMTFAEGQLASRTVEMDLPPGVSQMRWKNLGRTGALLVRDFRLEPAE